MGPAIKVGTFVLAPHLNACLRNSNSLMPNGNCTDPGFSSQLSGMALQLANIPYQLVRMDFSRDAFGRPDDTTGRWNGTDSIPYHPSLTIHKKHFFATALRPRRKALVADVSGLGTYETYVMYIRT